MRSIGKTWWGRFLIGVTFLPGVAGHAATDERSAQRSAEPPPTADLIAQRVEHAPRLDGRLDDPAWRGLTPLLLRYETDPAENQPADVRTEVFVVYDQHALYVAFRAFDPEPGAIRAHLSDRDQISRNDQVGFVLDTFHDERRGFAFLSNPLGVQADMLVAGLGTPASGSFAFTGSADEDFAWDAIWSVAGAIDGEGYVVEFAIPFTSLRFPADGTQQSWGFVPVRGRPRSVRQRYHATPLDRSRNCFLCQAATLSGLQGIAPGRDVEFDPTVIYTDRQVEAGSRSASEGDAEFGLTARWGVTPNLTLGAVVNPDFSQIEADALQLAVNTRFALFFDEKRPFFLEGADFFTTPINAVHTRTVLDPDFGVKLTGKTGRNAWGAFVVRDSSTGLLLPAEAGSRTQRLEHEAHDAAVLRWRADLGTRSTIGALFTGRDGDGYQHALGAIDARLLLTDNHALTLQHLRSENHYPTRWSEPSPVGPGLVGLPTRVDGNATLVRYDYDSRDWYARATWQALTPGFRADTGFVARVDIDDANAEVGRVFWGDATSFWKRQQYSLTLQRIDDDAGHERNRLVQLSTQLLGPLQSFVALDLSRAAEYFAGDVYHQDRARLFVNVRWNGAVTSSIDIDCGDAIDFAGSRPATVVSVNPEFTLNLGRHFFIGGEYTRQRLTVDQGRLFSVEQIDGKIVYQFTPRMFLRTIVQRTVVDRTPSLFSFEVPARSVEQFTQLLFSYKLNPFTVFYAGATDCRECQALPPQEQFGFAPDRQQTVFIKLGYAWQL